MKKPKITAKVITGNRVHENEKLTAPTTSIDYSKDTKELLVFTQETHKSGKLIKMCMRVCFLTIVET